MRPTPYKSIVLVELLIGSYKQNISGKRFFTTHLALLALFLVFITTSVAISEGSANTTRVELSLEENAWLAEHPEIVLGTSTSYPPHVVKNPDGTYSGVLPDLYEAISQVLDTRVCLHIEDFWPGIQTKAENRELDGLAIGGRDPIRDVMESGNFSLAMEKIS